MNYTNESYITSQEQLSRALELISRVKTVAIDTEFTYESTYYPILSIIQLAVSDQNDEISYFIIDALSNLDLQGFYEIISDPEIIKILHSPLQDLQILYKKSQLIPHSVFDTQLMANFCNMGFNIGYSNLVGRLFGVSLNKNQQRSDWQRRPLSQKQIEYALADVKFLERIYAKLLQILVEQNRVDWFFEEMKNFLNRALFKSDESLYKTFSFFRGKDQKQITQIKSLILWREDWARRMDVPRRHFMRDEVIDKIVSGEIFNLNLSQEILDEIETVINEDFEFSCAKTNSFMTERQKSFYQESKKLIQDISEQCGIESRFLMPNHDLKKLAFDHDFFNEKVSGWRYHLFGKQLEHLLSSV